MKILAPGPVVKVRSPLNEFRRVRGYPPTYHGVSCIPSVDLNRHVNGVQFLSLSVEQNLNRLGLRDCHSRPGHIKSIL